MSQKTVLALLRQAGPSTTRELSKLAKERFPNSSLHLYCGDRLNKLHKWGMVEKDAKGVWHIVEGSV